MTDMKYRKHVVCSKNVIFYCTVMSNTSDFYSETKNIYKTLTFETIIYLF